MIELTGTQDIERFIRDLTLAWGEFDLALSMKFEAFTKEVFAELVTTTPQWTGDLASAWNYSADAPDYSYVPIPNKVEAQQHWSKADVYQRGAEPAVSTALAKAAGVHVSHRQIVYITNPAPIAEDVEKQQVLIRPINLMDGRVAMIDYYVDKYSRGGVI